MSTKLSGLMGTATELCLVACIAAIAGCASQPVNEIDMMPAPDVYGDGLLDPLPNEQPYAAIPYQGLLYATDRQPAGPDDKEEYYLNDRGAILRIGVARIGLGTKDFRWETAKRVSLLKNRTDEYPLKVTKVEEWGVLGSTVPFYTDGKEHER